MRLDFVWSAANVSISIIAVTVLIRNSTANSEPAVLYGRCQETAEKKAWRKGDRGIGRFRNRKMKGKNDGEVN
jgi:hypothetical protein